MSFCRRLEGSLQVRFFSLVNHRARTLLLGLFLMGGALIGMPIKPEEIEEQMRAMSSAKSVQLLEQEQQPSGDPPENGAEVGSTARANSQPDLP